MNRIDETPEEVSNPFGIIRSLLAVRHFNDCVSLGGILKVTNTKGNRIRVYIDEPNPYSYNFTMLVPPNSVRYFYGQIYGFGHDYVLMDESSTVLDQAQFHIANACDTAVIVY